jgi:tetratricopeptide (TPR) repeat protein
MNGTSAAQGPLANPFVGPKPLERGQPIFGRDREIEELYYLLSAERIVLLHSPSGAGKSSLLQAGLLPRLQAQFDVWAPARVSLQPRIDAGFEETRVMNRYVRSCILGFEADVPKELERPIDVIGKMTLADYVATRPRRRSAPKNLALIFDQFEEILTIDPVSIDAKHEFFTQLGQLLMNPHIWAIFALREDYLAPFDPYASLVPTNLKNRFRLDLLGRDAASEAIEKTAEMAGRSFTPEALKRLVSDLALMLVQRPDGEFAREPGPYIEPLHLQVACLNLWQRMEPDRTVIEESDIAKFGDVSVALADYYASEVGKTADGDVPAERDIRLWFGEKLIRLGKVRGSVLREHGLSGNLANELIEMLIKSHLVRPEQRAGATWYELAHDRLIEPVLRDNEIWFAEHLNKLQQRALQWDKEGEPGALLLTGKDLAEAERWAERPNLIMTPTESRFLDACRQKRWKMLQARGAVATLIVFLIVISVSWFLAWRAQKRAEANLALAKLAVDESLSSAGREQARESQDSPEVERLRKELLTKAATFYTALIQANAGTRDLREESASAHSRLADIDRLLDNRDDAVSEYKNAIAGFEAVARDNPKEVTFQQSLGYCHNWLGETMRQWYEQEETPDKSVAAQATTEYDAALQLQQRIHDAAPSNAQYAQELARTHYNRGILENDVGDPKSAEADFRTAMGLLEPLDPLVGKHITEDPTQTTRPAAQDLARTDNDLANLEAKNGNSADARALYERAIAIGEQLVAEKNDKREYKAELAEHYDNEARLLMHTGDEKLAAKQNRHALDLIRELATPSQAVGLEEATILEMRIRILLKQDSPDAFKEAERERELMEGLESSGIKHRHSRIHEIYRELASSYIDLAKKELKSGSLEDAQLALKSLALVIPELAPGDKTDAENNYRYYRQKLKKKEKHADSSAPSGK